MLENIKRLLTRKQGSLQGRIFTSVGLTISIILLTTGAFFAYTNWKYSKENALNFYTQQAQVNATGAKMRTYRAIGTARTMSISVDYMFEGSSISRDTSIKEMLNSVTQQLSKYNDITLYQAAYFSLDTRYLPGEGAEGRKFYIATLDKSGVTVIRKTSLDQTQQDMGMQRAESVQKTTISLPHMSSYPNGSPSAYVVSVAAPIVYNGKVVGSAGVDIPLEQLQRMITKTVVPEGASAYLVSPEGQVVAHTNSEQSGKMLPSTTDPELMKVFQTIFDEKGNGKGSYFVELDGKSHFVVPVNTDQTYTTWAMGLSIPNSVLYHEARVNMLIAILVSILGIVISLILSRKLAQRITTPINKINTSISKLGRGEVKSSAKLDIIDATEIGQISGSVNGLIDSLSKATDFAVEIGRENFAEELVLQGENDDIGRALIEMKESLQRSKNQEHQRQEEEKLTSWANEGLAKFSEILRSNHTDIKELSYNIISSLVKYLNVNQGGIFVQNDVEKEFLDMTACFAYNRRKLLEQRIEVTEGLVGRCFVEAEPIYLLEVPENYMTITSGLGDTPARCLLLVPLKVDNQVNGVIEIASIEPIAEYKMKFIVKVAESIASTLNGARINERTAMLLEQTKLQGEEMAAAEEEMRQNLEELQSTQEEMNRVQEDQKMAMDKIAVDSHMFDMLLTSTSDYMFFKDVNGKFQRLSDSSTVLLNVQQVEDAIGKTVFDLLPSELATELDTDDQLAIAHKKPIVKMVSRITLVDGTVQNIEKNKYPILNSDGNVIGLTCIYKILANA